MKEKNYSGVDVKKFYNEYGEREWQRMDLSAYQRINFHLHMHFLKDHIGEGKKVLDAGCGAGRYSIEFLKLGSDVTLLDISDEQINIAKMKVQEAGLIDKASDFLVGDISNLHMFEDETFDTTVCYGAALSYLLENTEKAMSELKRVTKKGGTILISVNSKWGIFRTLIGRKGDNLIDFYGRPDYWYIDQVAETGDLPEHPDVKHPPRHFFHGKELEELMIKFDLKDIQLGSSPCISCGFFEQADLLEKDPKAWETIIKLEEQAYCQPTFWDSGEFLLAKGRRE